MVVTASGGWSWWIEVGLGMTGVLASLLFLRETQRGGTLPGCGPHSDCQSVAGSRWAKVGSIPVSLFGLLLYGGLMGAVFASRVTILSAVGRTMAAVAGAALIGAAVWFSLLQLLVLRRVCKFCMIYHMLGAITGSIALTEKQDSMAVVLAIGGCLMGVIIVLQVLVPAKTHVVLSMVRESRTGPTAVESNSVIGISKDAQHSSHAHWSLLGGRVPLTEADWPLLGPPEARRKVALMFDVTCLDCRALYQLLAKLVMSQPGNLAVSLIPVPLDRACNEAVPAETPVSTEACQYVRLFWAAWAMEQNAGSEFSWFLMGDSTCPPYSQVRDWLHRRHGSALTMALLDSGIEARIQNAVALFRAMPANKLPQLLLEERLVVGRLAGIDELREILELT